MSVPSFTGYLSPPGSAFKGYQAMDEGAYHAFPAVSGGLLAETTQAEMLFNRQKPPSAGNDSESLVLGTLVHAVCLEPWKFGLTEWEKHFALCPTKGLDTKAANEVRAANPGKLLVTPELLDTASRIRKEAIETNPDAVKYLSSPNGMAEATCITWDPVFQCSRKIRVDYLPRSGSAFGNYLLDIKTTRKPLHSFEFEARKLGYFLKAAWYLDTHELLTGHRPEMFIWLAVTNVEPYMSRLFFMRNRRQNDPLYGDPNCQLRIGRERIGLDPSARVGRLPTFLEAARETESMRVDGIPLTATNLRRVWTGYETAEMTEIL